MIVEISLPQNGVFLSKRCLLMQNTYTFDFAKNGVFAQNSIGTFCSKQLRWDDGYSFTPRLITTFKRQSFC
jgi:hypothetical protein